MIHARRRARIDAEDAALSTREGAPSLGLALVLALLGSGCAPGPPPVMRPPDRELRFETTGVLIGHANGIKVFVSPDAATNLVEVDMRIAAGSRDEAPAKAGLAHLVEHATFELGPAGGPSFGQRLSALALAHNAGTDHDVTHFRATAPASALPELLATYAALLSGDCEGLAPEVFEREREVVRNELRQRRARDDSAALTAEFYPRTHPYHHGVAGTMATLNAITRADVCEFYAQRYAPGNATFVVSGAVRPDEVEALSNRLLRPLPERPVPARAAVPGWRGAGGRQTVLIEGSKHAFVLAFPYPPRFHPGELAARHLRLALTTKLAELAEDLPEVTETRVGVIGGREAPILVAVAELRRHDFHGRAEALLWRAVEETRALAADPIVHQITSQILRFQTVRAVEPLSARGDLYADYLDAPAGWGFFAGDVARIDALDVGFVKATTPWLFDRESSVMLEIIPDKRQPAIRGPSFTALPEGHLDDEVAPAEMGPLSGLPAPPKIERYTLSNGLEVILAPIAGMPVVELRLIVRVGHREAPPDRPYLALLAAHLRSPGGWNAVGDARVMSLAGADVEVAVDEATTTFSTAGLGIYVDYLLEGLSANVIRTEYYSESLQRLKRSIRTGLAKRRGSERSEAEGRFFRALLGPQCVETRDIDEIATGRYSTVDMRRFKRDRYRAANATLIVVGNFDRELAKNHVEINFGRSGGPREYRSWNHPALPRTAGAAVSPRRGPEVTAEVDEARPLLELVVGFPLPTTIQRDPAAGMLLQELVRAEVRSVRTRLGASYGLQVQMLERCGVASLLIAGEVDPAQAQEARAEIARGLDRLRDAGALAPRFLRARAAVLRRLHAAFGDSQAVAGQLAFASGQELGPEAFTSIARRVSEFDVAQAATLTRAALAELMILCRGPRAAVQGACEAAK